MPKKLLLLPPLSVSSAFRAPRACPASRPAMNAARTGYRVFSANSTAACTELAKRITERLGAELGKSVVYQETNGETRVEIKESVRGQDIFIIQTIPSFQCLKGRISSLHHGNRRRCRLRSAGKPSSFSARRSCSWF